MLVARFQVIQLDLLLLQLFSQLQQLQPVLMSFVFLVSLTTASGSCDYSSSRLSLDDVRLSTAINQTDSRFRVFLDATLADCEKECGLRMACGAYNYHRVMHLCELHVIEYDDDTLQSFLIYHPESIFRRMTGIAKRVSKLWKFNLMRRNGFQLVGCQVVYSWYFGFPTYQIGQLKISKS